MPVRLAELLLAKKTISPEQLQAALDHQNANGGKLSKAIVSLGFLKDEEITKAVSRQYGVPSLDLGHLEVDPAIIKIIPAETALKYQVLPLSCSGRTLTIAMADPTNVFAMDDIKFMTGYNLETRVASESALGDAIDRYYESIPPWKRAARVLDQGRGVAGDQPNSPSGEDVRGASCRLARRVVLGRRGARERKPRPSCLLVLGPWSGMRIRGARGCERHRGERGRRNRLPRGNQGRRGEAPNADSRPPDNP